MVLELKKTLAHLSEEVAVQEAEALLEWIQANPKGKLVLTDCTHLHTAVLQVILRTGVAIQKPPTDPDLALWLDSVAAQ